MEKAWEEAMIMTTFSSVFILLHEFLFNLFNRLANDTADFQQQGTCVSEYVWEAFVFSRSTEMLQDQHLSESAVYSYIS